MNQSNHTAFGSWESPIKSQLIVSDAVSLNEIQLDEEALYHLESRPQEKGRCVIVKTTDSGSTDILPAPYSARSRVHEYGGGVYCLAGDRVYFVNDSDQDIYCITDNVVNRITNHPDTRFADLSFDTQRQSIIAVCEQHHNAPNDSEPDNTLVAIDIADGRITTLCSGYDFYASPRLSPDNKKLCWLSWNHPNMPWDGTELWLGEMDAAGTLNKTVHLYGQQSSEIYKEAADDTNISICQPCWSPDNHLYFISDHDGWWRLYRHEENTKATAIHPCQLEGHENNVEIGQPQWVFAQSDYAFFDADTIVSYRQTGDKSQLTIIDTRRPDTPINLDSAWSNFTSLAANTCQLAFIGSSGTSFPAVVRQTYTQARDYKKADAFTRIRTSTHLNITSEYYSQAQAIRFQNRHQQEVHAFYYPPTNPDYNTGDDCREKPPLIVICHGGPTASTGTSLDPKKQFWTSRGFALLDVNYSGSTGYGRDYRRRLNSRWGVLDVEDCCDAALYAVQQGLADKNRLIIRGSSAGGYTVLCALTFFDVFSASASYYGISELESLATDTHKFESRYLDRLIGPYPEQKTVYRQRSPIHHTEQLTCPVIFFQGIEDKVVPKEQAEKMIEALDKKGIAVASRFFAGEQHGFRQAKTITATLDNELYFYSRIFGFATKDGKEIEIKNLKADDGG